MYPKPPNTPGTLPLSADHQKPRRSSAAELAQGLRAFAALRGHGFDSQHPQGGSQPSVTPVPGDLMSSDLYGYPASKTLVYIK